MFLLLKTISIAVKLKLILVGVTLIFIALYSFDFTRFLSIGNDSGVIVRLNTIDESLSAINAHMFFGNGFGFELDTKKFHQENSFLDIAVEQGLIGIFLYCVLFFHIFTKSKESVYLAISVAIVAIMSLTNPYINNPLGISLILLTMLFCDKKINNKSKLL